MPDAQSSAAFVAGIAAAAALVAAFVAAAVSVLVSVITALTNRALDIARWRREERSSLNVLRREWYSKLLTLSLQVERNLHVNRRLVENMVDLEQNVQMLGEPGVRRAARQLAELHYQSWSGIEHTHFRLEKARRVFAAAARKELGVD